MDSIARDAFDIVKEGKRKTLEKVIDKLGD